MQREKLQKYFEKKGYFELQHKKAIPLFPRSIGIVTANNSAALKDILQTINRRYPLVKLKLFHTVVQGAKAPKNIATAIQKAVNYHQEVTTIDLLIIARGGGSIEDL